MNLPVVSQEYNVFLLVHEDDLQLLVMVEDLLNVVLGEVLDIVSPGVQFLQFFVNLIQVHLLGRIFIHDVAHIVDHLRHDVIVAIVSC
jgi:hypothetical protein